MRAATHAAACARACGAEPDAWRLGCAARPRLLAPAPACTTSFGATPAATSSRRRGRCEAASPRALDAVSAARGAGAPRAAAASVVGGALPLRSLPLVVQHVPAGAGAAPQRQSAAELASTLRCAPCLVPRRGRTRRVVAAPPRAAKRGLVLMFSLLHFMRAHARRRLGDWATGQQAGRVCASASVAATPPPTPPSGPDNEYYLQARARAAPLHRAARACGKALA
jgi:hypothetical protein